MNPVGLSMLAAAMADDGLPTRDPDDDDGPGQQPPLTCAGSADPDFYRAALVDAHAASEPIVLGAFDDGDLTDVAKHTLRCADQLALTVRLYQPGGFDPAYGEHTDAYISVTGTLAPIRGSAFIGADYEPMLPISRADIASPEAFLARFDDAKRTWAIVDAKVPPIEIL